MTDATISTLAKAWRVEGGDGYDDAMCIVFAATRNHAKTRGANELDLDYSEVSAKRAPEFDGITDEHDLIREQLRQSWHFECWQCRTTVYGDEGQPCVVRDGGVFCSSACCLKHLRDERQRRGDTWEALERGVAYWPAGVQITGLFRNVAGEWLYHLVLADGEHRCTSIEIDKAVA